MKIALFDSQANFGGAQRFLLDLGSGLLARRQDVVVILGADGPLRRACEQRGITVLPCPLSSRPRWKVLVDLLRLCRQHQVRRLFANSPICALYGGIVMRLLRGRACWRVFRTADITASMRQTRINAAICHSLYVATPTIAGRLHEQVGRRSHILVAPPAIDLTQFQPQPPPRRKRAERPVIGMIAAWESQSGQEVAVKAVKLLNDSGCFARMRLASAPESPEEARYREVVQGAIQVAGLPDRIILEGEIRGIPHFLAQCDVVIAPWLRESTGRLALEAAAAGRPIVASRVPGLEEMVEDDHAGLLVPPNDPQALADALALLLVSPALRAEMGRQARIRAEEHYAMTTFLDTLEHEFLPDLSPGWTPTTTP